MKILLINPPYQTFTSNLGAGHQVPLGLLMLGGPLIDAGYEVRLLDAEGRRLAMAGIVQRVLEFAPHIVMTGHAGSTPAHPVCMDMLSAIKQACPDVITVYGGVYPTYHAGEILRAHPQVDIIVRGEGEAAAVELAAALCMRTGQPSLQQVPGISFCAGDVLVDTPDRPVIPDLDSYRVGWELIDDWDLYQCFGLGRAAIVQFSRGCPHRCTYCGQHGFWVRWRHRGVRKFVDEIEALHHLQGICFFTLADENPTTDKALWKELLEELASRRLPVHFFATIRATDIVRDADILPLYKQAGLLYILLGIDATNPDTIRAIRKGSSTRHDLLACRLLKRHGILSILGHIVGLADDSWDSFRSAGRQLRLYDGDFLNAMYVTPHSWTQFGLASQDRAFVQRDQRKWDYRHQVLAQPHLQPWQIFLAVKWLELAFHMRPRRLIALLLARDRFLRRQQVWSLAHISRVWLAEVWEFVVHTHFEVLDRTVQRR